MVKMGDGSLGAVVYRVGERDKTRAAVMVLAERAGEWDVVAEFVKPWPATGAGRPKFAGAAPLMTTAGLSVYGEGARCTGVVFGLAVEGVCEVWVRFGSCKMPAEVDVSTGAFVALGPLTSAGMDLTAVREGRRERLEFAWCAGRP
jgi:hypothetical protein